MRQSWKVYVVAVIVLVVSFVVVWTLPTTEILRGIVSLPGVGALFAVLYQIVRDQAAHERALELQATLDRQIANLCSANQKDQKYLEVLEKRIQALEAGVKLSIQRKREVLARLRALRPHRKKSRKKRKATKVQYAQALPTGGRSVQGGAPALGKRR